MDPILIPAPAVIQPRILSSFIDAFGRFHVIDEHGETVLPHCCTGGTNFGLAVDWPGGTAECRWSHTADAANNRSYVNVELWAHTSGFTTYGTGYWWIRNGWDDHASFNVSISGGWVKVWGVERWQSHAIDGSLNIQVGVSQGYVANTSFRAVSGIQTHGLSNFTRVPSPPSTPTSSAKAATSMTFSWNYPETDAGQPILEYHLDYSLSSSFSSGVETVSSGTSRSKNITGLTPGKTYYARVRGRNADGFSGNSGTGNGLTLPPAPTGMALSESETTSILADWADTLSATGYDVQHDDNSGFSSPTTIATGDSIERLTSLKSATKYYVRARAKNGSGTGAWGSAANRVTKPAAAGQPTLSAVTTTGMTASWSKGSANGNEITEYDIQWATNSGFTGATTVTSTSTTKALTGMTPGTTHYVRVRAKNAVGTGAWSPTSSQVTLPSVPPGLKVVPSADGKSAVLTFTPPGGVTGVDKYDWERRATGTTSPVATGSEPDTSETVTGLNPGSSYDWRATAWIDAYESPVSAWVTAVQPKPNVSAGDYFDGDTTDTPEITYGWTGTADNSTSTATAPGVLGWRSYNGPVLSQFKGGVSGAYAARVTFKADAEGANGLNAGTMTEGMAAVVVGATYAGSMWVRSSRVQRVALYMYFYDAAAASAGNVYGDEVVLPPNVWVRLSVFGAAPANAVNATLRARDVSGEGWSVWQGGDIIELDAAMISLGTLYNYFDGSTPDTGDWDFQWEGTAHQSISSAHALDNSDYDPLEDPDCPRPPRAPRPPVITDDCIVPIGTWQRYWAVIPETVVTEWLTMVPTILLKIGAEAARQVRIRIYPNPDNLPVEGFGGEWSSEQIVSYLPPNSQMLIDGVDQRSWATVDSGERMRADHLLYGTGGTPATWPLLTCGIGYLASFDVPVDAEVGNLEIEIALTQRRS